VIIVGERLNSTRRPVYEALARKDRDYLIREARKQKEAGAAFIDLNTATLLDREVETLEWAVPILQKEAGVALSIDTPNPKAMEVALRLHEGQAILNSLTAESGKVKRMLPIIREARPLVIVLCLDDQGLPKAAEKEAAIAQEMVNFLGREGIEPDRIFVDPLVRPVAVDEEAGKLFLASLRKIKQTLPGVRTIAGLSNVSFGLPRRSLLNRSFLALALMEGLDAAILDPLDRELTATLGAVEALLGRDTSLQRFLALARKRNVCPPGSEPGGSEPAGSEPSGE